MMKKRRIVIAIVVLLSFLILFGVIPTGSKRYRSDSIVLAMPYTNTLFAGAFEAHVLKTIPRIQRLEVSRIAAGPPTSGRPSSTNGATIRLIAFGPTPEAAQNASNEAAQQLNENVLTNYGVTGVIIDRSIHSSRYSPINDTLIPAIRRLFKP